VLLTEALGSDMLAHLSICGTDATARLPGDTIIRGGDRVRLLVDPTRLYFFDPQTELAIG
jgi:ABC-type sugar transport system ATPase subunit